MLYNVPVQRTWTRYRYDVHEAWGKDEGCVIQHRVSQYGVSQYGVSQYGVSQYGVSQYRVSGNREPGF
jgi:hypothetical protein